MVCATLADDGWQLEATTELVADGPVDETVKGWVDEHFRQVRENERGTGGGVARYPSPDRCTPCHEDSVRAWRERLPLVPHAGAQPRVGGGAVLGGGRRGVWATVIGLRICAELR